MSQFDWNDVPLDPDEEDGTELAARLNSWVTAVLSMHRGTDEPDYVVAGMLWPKSVSGTVEQIYYYDGTQSVLLATVNPTTHVVQYPAAALPAATTSAQGASELLTTTEFLTGTDASRAATADSAAALWEDGGTINASGSISLGEGGSFDLITSTANITGFTFAVAKTGRRAVVRFSTARTLVNGANLILPGGANITTAAGDRCEVEDRGGGVARVNWYTKADGTPVVAPISIPTATILDFAGSTAPVGFLLCDGSAVSRSTYSDLFALLSTTYGAGNGTTTFNVPDLRGRVTAGKDDMGGSSADRLSAVYTNISTSNGSTNLSTVSFANDIAVGMLAIGPGIQPGSVVVSTSVTGGGIVLSLPATATASNVTVRFCPVDGQTLGASGGQRAWQLTLGQIRAQNSGTVAGSGVHLLINSANPPSAVMTTQPTMIVNKIIKT